MSDAASQTKYQNPNKPQKPRIFFQNAPASYIEEFAKRSGDYDLNYESSALTDYDISVFFLDGWKAGLSMDGMENIESELKKQPEDIGVVHKKMSLKDGRQTHLFFYNTKGSNIDFKCLSQKTVSSAYSPATANHFKCFKPAK